MGVIIPFERIQERKEENMKTKVKAIVPTEGEEQATLFSWAQMKSGKYPELRLLFHIPNGGERSKSEAARFKAEGVKPGVPDLFLPAARYPWNGLFVELKRQKGGRVSDAQRLWLTALEGEGYRVAVACGWQEAAQIILDYLEGRA